MKLMILIPVQGRSMREMMKEMMIVEVVMVVMILMIEQIVNFKLNETASK